MNYIDLLNHFWKINKEFSFTPNEKSVYFALLYKWNDLHRKNPFNMNRDELANEAGVSISTIKRARILLTKANLIEFDPGDGRRNNTVYTILHAKKEVHTEPLLNKKGSHTDPLNKIKGVHKEVHTEPLSGGNVIEKGATENHYISKLIEERIPSIDEEVRGEKEEGIHSQKNPIPLGTSSVYSSMDDVEFICLNQSQIWHESMMKKFGIKDQEKIKKWIGDFFFEQRAAGQDKREMFEARKHCYSWINIQVENQKEKSSGKKEKVFQNQTIPAKGVDAAMEWAGVERRKNV